MIFGYSIWFWLGIWGAGFLLAFGLSWYAFRKSLRQSFLINGETSEVSQWMRGGLIVLSFVFLGRVLLEPPAKVDPQLLAEAPDTLFLLDISKSMLARDEALPEGRIEAAKGVIRSIVSSSLEGRIGLLAFSGSPLNIAPLMSDDRLFLDYLNSVKVGDIPEGGTNIQAALSQALARLSVEGLQKAPQKRLVLISDGEETLDNPTKIWAERLKEKGFLVFVVGVGSLEGAQIPESQDFFGRIRYKTFEGKPLIVRRDDSGLSEIARLSHGRYEIFEKKSDQGKISKAFFDFVKEKGSVSDLKLGNFAFGNHETWVFLSLIFFLGGLIVPRTRRTFSRSIPLSSNFVMLISMGVLFSGCAPLEPYQFRWEFRSGVEAMKVGKMEIALEHFDRSKNLEPKEYFGISEDHQAAIYYQKSDYEKAKKIWESFTQNFCKESPSPWCSRFLYHLGNTEYQLGTKEKCHKDKKEFWDRAIEDFEKTNQFDPLDEDAKYNKTFVEKSIEDLKNRAEPPECKKNPPPKKDNPDPKAPPSSGSGENPSENPPPPQNGEPPKPPENPSDPSAGQNPPAESASKPSESPTSPQAKAPPPLSSDEQKALEQYQQKMERQQKELGDSFHRRGNSETSSHPFSGDPFFESFFEGNDDLKKIFDEFLGQPLNGEGGEGKSSEVEKDW